MPQGDNKHHWTPEEDYFLKQNFFSLTNQQLADALNLKLTITRRRCYDFGLKRMLPEYWTKEQTQFLKANYKTIGDTELAIIFTGKWHKNKGWSKKHINKKRRYLFLKRTPTQIKNIHQRNVDNGYFAECAVKRWKGRTTPIGSIKVWHSNGGQRAFIKIKKGFTPYARWFWIKEKGRIAPGMVVKILNDKVIPDSLEDLELITRAENAQINAEAFHCLPKELKTAIKLTNKIQKLL
jgi:hypothetical protein